MYFHANYIEGLLDDRTRSDVPRAFASLIDLVLGAIMIYFSRKGQNLKARLAFAGWEATVQQGLLPDKIVRFRVRLGPYDNQDEMQRIKSELGKRGFEAAVIRF